MLLQNSRPNDLLAMIEWLKSKGENNDNTNRIMSHEILKFPKGGLLGILKKKIKRKRG